MPVEQATMVGQHAAEKWVPAFAGTGVSLFVNALDKKSRARTRMRLGQVMVVAAFLTSPATGSTAPSPLWYGSNLARLCYADSKSADYAMCWSFIGAVVEIAQDNPIDGLKVCLPPPPAFDIDKAVEITKKWLRDHPDADIKAASLVTTEALAQRFPCK